LTYFLPEGSAASFVGKCNIDEDVEAVLQTMERLTQDEAHTTVAEILQVVHDLVRNMNIAMNGEHTRSAFTHRL
jgi:hypothetical protein